MDSLQHSQSLFTACSSLRASTEENVLDRIPKMPRTEEPTLELDPEGDVTLIIEDVENDTTRYLVSSKTLSLASRYFDRMFKTEFREGIAVRADGNPEITLKECHRMAMDVVLRILHHKGNPMPKQSDPGLVAWVAVECERYDVWKPVLPYFEVWTRGWESQCWMSAESVLGRMLLATWMAKIPRLRPVLEAAMYTFVPGFEDRLSVEPIWEDRTEILNEILEGIKAIEFELQAEMQRELVELTEDQPDIPGFDKVATCPPSTRVAQYIRGLVTNGLWPMYHGSHHKSLKQRFDLRRLPHECVAGVLSCPLTRAWSRLSDFARRDALWDVADAIKTARFASRDSQGEQHESPDF